MPSLSVVLQLLVITHATVVDPDAARPRRDQTIVVRGTRIERELLGLLGRDIESGDHDKAGG